MRPVFESVHVQCRVYWDAEAGKATVIDQRDRRTVFIPGENSYTVLYPEGITKVHSLDVPAMVIDGRVMLPLRALLENFAYKVHWNDDEQRIVVNDNRPSWRRLMKPDAWAKALEEDCVPCALVKEAP